MANEERLRILKQEGIDAWDNCLKENPDVAIDLLIDKKSTKPRKFVFFNTCLTSILTLLALTSPALACPGISETLTFEIPVRDGYGSQTQNKDNPITRVTIQGYGEIISYEGSPAADWWDIQAYVNDKRVFQENNTSVGSKAEFEVCGRSGRNEIELVATTSKNINGTLIIKLHGKACPLVADFWGLCS